MRRAERLTAYAEVMLAICSVTWPKGSTKFILNNTRKEANGVVPIKDPCYAKLEDEYHWFREKPLEVLKVEKGKGGPIDAYKEYYHLDGRVWRVGLEFETGNISSAHRSMNKLTLGMKRQEVDLGIIVTPMRGMAYYLTDRISNYEELAPYFELAEEYPFIFIGFRQDAFDPSVAAIPKGPDGQSPRAKRLWSKRNEIV